MWLGRGRGCLRWDWCNPEVDQGNQENRINFSGKTVYCMTFTFLMFPVLMMMLHYWRERNTWRKEKAYCDVKRWQTWLQKSIRWGSGPQRPTVQLLVISEMRHKYIYSIFHASLLNHGLVGNKLLLLSLRKGGFFLVLLQECPIVALADPFWKFIFFIGPKNDSI